MLFYVQFSYYFQEPTMNDDYCDTKSRNGDQNVSTNNSGESSTPSSSLTSLIKVFITISHLFFVIHITFCYFPSIESRNGMKINQW